MLRKPFMAFIVLAALALGAATAAGQEQAAAEDVKTRPNKQEIIDWMSRAGAGAPSERDARVDAILKQSSAGRTPRSDFTFCAGLAYLGDPKAQICAGRAYEFAWGVVEDLSEAYAWYAVAAESASADASEREKAAADRDRVKNKLLSVYPAPSDDDLEDLVREHKSRMEQYRKAATR